MSPMRRADYPPEWETMVAEALAAADGRCQGCGVRNREDGTNATTLTTHHPDRDKANPAARLTVLCAGCHLAVEPRARRREAVHEQRGPGESVGDTWRRLREGAIAGQMTLDNPRLAAAMRADVSRETVST